MGRTDSNAQVYRKAGQEAGTSLSNRLHVSHAVAFCDMQQIDLLLSILNS